MSPSGQEPIAPATSLFAEQTNIPGGWREQAITVADREFHLLLPADPDQFLDFLTPSGNHPSWEDPYWAKLWPTSVELAKRVYAAAWLEATRIVEIGCGVGLPGLAACARGWQVAFSDYIPLAMDLALENARRNNLPSATSLPLDWRAPTQHAFDIVLASEVLYDRTLHLPFLHTLSAILADNGTVWLGDPGRTAAEEFIPTAQAAGWKITITDATSQSRNHLLFNQFNCIELSRK